MPAISVHHLSKTYRVARKQPGFLGTLRHFMNRQYNEIEAVKSASFTIEPGEFVGFLGPNGAGKTTALKMLTGLIHPTSGNVNVAGYEPFKRSYDFLREITLVMGNKQQLIWDLPALDSLRINAAVYEIAPNEYRERVDELSGMLGLDEELKQPVRKLSLGQRMKCELLAALLHRPSVLFLDEPTLGLDVNAQVAVRQFLKQYNEKYNATILLTSHYMADITALCERVMVIHKGALMYDGLLDQLVDRFAPYRQVRFELNEPLDGIDLSRFGEVEKVEGRSAAIIVRREHLTVAVDRLLDELDIHDLTITDPPIEEIIGRLFTDGMIDEPAAAEAVTT